jgi:hypothetical protein
MYIDGFYVPYRARKYWYWKPYAADHQETTVYINPLFYNLGNLLRKYYDIVILYFIFRMSPEVIHSGVYHVYVHANSYNNPCTND